MKFIVTLILFLMPLVIVSAQSLLYEDCDTEDLDTASFKRLPWFGNNEYLDNFIDSMGYPLSGGHPLARVEGSDVVRYRIPVNFIIYRDDNGNGGPNAFELQRLMDKLNNDHRINNTGIRFYQKCNVTYVNNSNRLTMSASFGTWWSGVTAAEAVHSDMLNVHIVKTINKAFTSEDPAGRYNKLAEQSVFIIRSVYSDEDLASTLTHEVGHFLELAHTHQYQFWRGWPIENCVVEPVDRSRRFADITLCEGWFANSRKCSSTGDALCDTPADPKIDQPNECVECVWERDLDDIYGDSYLNPPSGSQRPNPHNIMSYGDKACRDLFTRQQTGVMVHSLERGRHFLNGISWRNSTSVFDTFEPDNEFATAREVVINNLDEHRTFHQNCDEDWVKFTAVSGKVYTVLTKEVAGELKADTEIFLYKNNGGILTLIQSHNDISADNKFSQISRTLESGQYVVKVKRINPSGTQHYKLQVSDFCYDFLYAAYSITDQTVVCSTNKVFTLQNRYPGSTVSWSHSSNLTYVSGHDTNSLTVKAQNSETTGSGWVRLNTSFDGCVDVTLADETFWVGKPMIDGSYNGQLLRYMLPDDDIIPYNFVCNSYYNTCEMTFRGSTSGNWQKVSSNPSSLSWSQSGNNLNFYFWAVGQTSSYRLTTSNTCGTTTNYYYFKSIDCSGGGGDPCNQQYAVSPNPSSSTISIVVPNVPPPCESSMISNQEGELVENKLTIQSIGLYDSDGLLKRSQKYGSKTKSVAVEVSDLRKGVYILKISDGSYVETHRVIIE